MTLRIRLVEALPVGQVRALPRICLLGLLLASFIFVAIGATVSAESRTTAYAKFQFGWSQAWPFSRRLYTPLRFAPLLRQTGIDVPVRIGAEPGISFLLDPGDVIERRILA